MMNEQLLTPVEIEEIQVSFKNNPWLKDPNILWQTHKRSDILKVTPINEVIFIKGDSDTGFTHISERHSYWSDKYYWKIINNKESLEDPSKFSTQSIPIGDYIDIADSLYCSNNLNIFANKNPEVLEVYEGGVQLPNSPMMKYRMLIYKKTRIVHTLFPLTRTNNRKKILNLRKGNAKGTIYLSPPRATLAVHI